MFETAKTLIVVYKDEMLLNQLKKMIQTNDDLDEGKIVGVKDGSLNVVSWDEQTWLNNKKAGNIKDKVLFLGDIKGTDKLIPVIDVKFNKYGVKYGWAGDQAIVYVEIKELIDGNKYEEFIKELSNFPIPEAIKKSHHLTYEETQENIETNSNDNKNENSGVKDIIKNIKSSIDSGVKAAKKAKNTVVTKVLDDLNKNNIKKQMLFYGIFKLYNNELEDFMNS